MTLDLPWAPASGKTALYVVARNASCVLCADKEHPAFRTLWTADGRMLAQGGRALTLDGFPRASASEVPSIDETERAVLLLLPVWPDATLAGLADYAAIALDKMLLRLLSLEKRGLITGDAEAPRHWTLTPAGEAALRATEPKPEPAPPDPVVEPTATVPPPKAAKPQSAQLSLF